MATLSELQKAPAGMPVTDLTCTVKRAFEGRNVKTQYGDKTVVDLILDDGSQEMRASWWDPALDRSVVQGAAVEIGARLNQKNQLSGAVIRHGKDKDGNARVELSISGDHLRLRETAQPATSSKTASATTNGKLSEDELYDLIARAANRLNDILTAAGGQPPTADALAASVNTIVIAATQGRIEVTRGEAIEETVPF